MAKKKLHIAYIAGGKFFPPKLSWRLPKPNAEGLKSIGPIGAEIGSLITDNYIVISN